MQDRSPELWSVTRCCRCLCCQGLRTEWHHPNCSGHGSNSKFRKKNLKCVHTVCICWAPLITNMQQHTSGTDAGCCATVLSCNQQVATPHVRQLTAVKRTIEQSKVGIASLYAAWISMYATEAHWIQTTHLLFLAFTRRAAAQLAGQPVCPFRPAGPSLNKNSVVSVAHHRTSALQMPQYV